MPDLEFTEHAKEILVERNIPEPWVWHAIESPDRMTTESDNTVHYIKSIPEHGGRLLRVVVNPQAQRIVTIFFDRQLRSKI